MILSSFGTGYACLHDGLGKPYYMTQDSLASFNSVSDLHSLYWRLLIVGQQIAIAGAITFILSIYLSKIATLLFMLRIGSIMRSRPFYYAFIVLSAVFCLASILVVTVDCPIASGYYWDFTGNVPDCPTQVCGTIISMYLEADQICPAYAVESHAHSRFDLGSWSSDPTLPASLVPTNATRNKNHSRQHILDASTVNPRPFRSTVHEKANASPVS